MVGDITVMRSNNVSRYVSNSFDSKYGKNGQLRDANSSFIVLSLNNLKLNNTNLNILSRQLWAKFKHYETCSYIVIESSGKILKLNKKLIKGSYADFRKEVISIKDKSTE